MQPSLIAEYAAPATVGVDDAVGVAKPLVLKDSSTASRLFLRIATWVQCTTKIVARKDHIVSIKHVDEISSVYDKARIARYFYERNQSPI